MPRIIKKYANRRLYDTEESRYITLDDIRELILKDIEFNIISAKDESDLTNQVLLQVIGESENPVMTNTILKYMIRFYHGNQHQLFVKFMENTLKWYQDHCDSNFNNLLDSWLDFNQKQLENWQKMLGF